MFSKNKIHRLNKLSVKFNVHGGDSNVYYDNNVCDRYHDDHDDYDDHHLLQHLFLFEINSLRN